jgi:hypothetical protein
VIGRFIESNRYAPWLLVAILTILEVVTQKLIHGHWADKITLASYNIATGHAEWRIYQSRVLGPYLILGLTKLLHVSYPVAREIFVPVFLLGSNLAIYRLLSAWFDDRKFALKVCFWQVFVFLFLQSSHFLYDWDVIDQLVFFLFGFGILTRKGFGWFFGLFLGELFNREAASFIALYICLRAMTDYWQTRKNLGRSLLLCGIGVVLALFDQLLTKLLRETLHKDPAAEVGKYRIVMGQMWQAPQNAKDMLPPIHSLIQIYPTLMVLSLAALFYRSWRLLKVQTLESAVVTGLIAVSLFLFALLTETRVLVALGPFLVLFAIRPERWIAIEPRLPLQQ